MANGHWTADPAPHKTCYQVELPDMRGAEYVHAERVRVDGGAVVFTNGGMSDLEMVAVYGPRGYTYVGRIYDETCERLGHAKDDD